MFLGLFEPTLLEKRRLALPKKIRSEVTGERIVLTVGFEHCILGFDEKKWNDVVRPELEKPFFSDSEARKMRRKMCVFAEVVELDSQGRFVIPDSMATSAQIDKDIVVIGAGDHFELWNRSHWNEYKQSL